MATLENRGGGSWRITVSGGYGPDGKQIHVRRTFKADPASTVNSQRKQAEKFAATLETDYARQQITDAKKVTVRSIFDDYIEDRCVRRGLAPRTTDDYKKLFNSRILPYFGKIAVRDITPKHLNAFFRDMKGKKGEKLSGTYTLKYYQQLNEFFTYCVRSRYITVNPCDLIEAPKRDTAEAEYYDKSECPAILEAIDNCPDPEWKAFFSLFIYCGTRPGELLGLNWNDYDGKSIFVQAGSYQGKGKKNIRTDRPKTKSGIREIVLPPDAISALNAWKAAQAQQRLKFGKEWACPEAVFTNYNGERLSKGRPSKRWKQFTAENNIRHLPLYDLRHTHCSLLIYSRELSVEEVSARMGHRQTSTTLNIYSHAFKDSSERATNALMNVLDSAKKAE